MTTVVTVIMNHSHDHDDDGQASQRAHETPVILERKVTAKSLLARVADVMIRFFSAYCYSYRGRHACCTAE
jgi:hypothetical protein